MSISCIAVFSHLMYVVLLSQLKTGIKGPINVIFSLHWKTYVSQSVGNGYALYSLDCQFLH